MPNSHLDREQFQPDLFQAMDYVHVAINSYNQLERKQKLRLNPPELFALGMAFAEKLNELGIEQAAILRPATYAGCRGKRHGKAQAAAGLVQSQDAESCARPGRAFAAPRGRKKDVALKAEIKEATLPFSPMRKEALAKLRELDKALILPPPISARRLRPLSKKYKKTMASCGHSPRT